MRELIGIHYSPWTEKARWALDHHQLEYRYTDHLLIFGMPYLFWRMKSFSPNLTVPALIDETEKKTLRLSDSWDIAVYADRIGKATKLFPEKHFEQIRYFNELSEKALDAGRALVLYRMSRDQGAQLEALSFLPKFLRKPLLPMAKVGMAYIKSSFESGQKTELEYESEIERILEVLKRELGQKKFLLGDFSYADVVMAVIFQVVKPINSPVFSLKPETAKVWGNELLSKKYESLLNWRDSIYTAHRLGKPLNI